MKLSKAQAKVMEEAMGKIEFARSVSFHDWVRKNVLFRIGENRSFEFPSDKTDEEIDTLFKIADKVGGRYDRREFYEKRYSDIVNGIVDTYRVSSTTLRKLEALGLIEIIKDSCGEPYGSDTIKVLNI